MRLRLTILSSILLLLATAAAPLHAAPARSGPFTLTANTQCTDPIPVGASASFAVDVTGTFSLTLQPEVLMTGQAVRNTLVIPTNSQTTQSTITAAGGYTAIQVAGYDSFQVCTTAYTSGTVTIYLTPSPAPVAMLGGGGGGSGTVTSVSVTTANGVSGSVATATTTPAISLTLGAVTPTSVAISDTAANSDLTESNTTTATSGTTNASPTLGLAANYWTGAASAADTWTFGTSLAAGTNAITTLTVGHTGSTGNPQVTFPITAQNTNPSITGPGVTTAGITVGAATNFPLKVLMPTTSGHVFAAYIGGTLTSSIDISSTDSSMQIIDQNAGPVSVGGTSNYASGTVPFLTLGPKSGAATGPTSGTYVGVAIGPSNGTAGLNWAPTANAANMVALQIAPTINQTSTASGSYTALKIAPIETALLGSNNYLIDAYAGSAGTTSKFRVDNAGVISSAGSAGITETGTLCTATFTTVGGIVTACTATSDPRLKVFAPSTRGLEAIMALRPISFHWNAFGLNINRLAPDAVNRQQTGFNAANVRSVMPEAVGESDGYLTLPEGDRPIVAALVVAMQQQERRIQALESEVQKLKGEPQ